MEASKLVQQILEGASPRDVIGAAANVIVVEAANASGHKISFLEFAKYGLLITFISLLISNAYIYFRFLM
jgi:Na+/H+ antiporter NhaD/arsenite permease-like protein